MFKNYLSLAERGHLLAVISEQASDESLVRLAQNTLDDRSQLRQDMAAIARRGGDSALRLHLNKVDEQKELGRETSAIDGKKTDNDTAPVSPPAAQPVVDTIPPGTKLARIGESARQHIMASMRAKPRTLSEIGPKYKDHLFTLYTRGEVKYDGGTGLYSLS